MCFSLPLPALSLEAPALAVQIKRRGMSLIANHQDVSAAEASVGPWSESGTGLPLNLCFMLPPSEGIRQPRA